MTMKLQAVVVGSGTREDPYTVPLPTWQMIDIDYQAGVAIIEVPEGVYPEAKGFTTRKVRDSQGKEHEILVPTSETLAVWEEVEAEKYPNIASKRALRDVVRGRR
jgi:hypothetical protein